MDFETDVRKSFEQIAELELFDSKATQVSNPDKIDLPVSFQNESDDELSEQKQINAKQEAEIRELKLKVEKQQQEIVTKNSKIQTLNSAL